MVYSFSVPGLSNLLNWSVYPCLPFLWKIFEPTYQTTKCVLYCDHLFWSNGQNPATDGNHTHCFISYISLWFIQCLFVLSICLKFSQVNNHLFLIMNVRNFFDAPCGNEASYPSISLFSVLPSSFAIIEYMVCSIKFLFFFSILVQNLLLSFHFSSLGLSAH